ncbi:MAG: cytochrome c3 family protein [Acidobacteriota bacterium]
MFQRTMVFLFVLSLVTGLTTGLVAQTKSTVFGTAHDISSLGGGCKSCHVPHQGSAKGEVLLWARSFPTTTTFGVYSSPTMNTTPTEVGGNYSATNLPAGVKVYTVLCLSCHDGLTTQSVINATDGDAIANPTNSDGLKNDHPVNLVYNPSSDPGLEPLTTAQAAGAVFFSDGSNQTVQCASCHNVHDNTKTPFLRVANTNAKSGLCTTCHK